LLLSYLITVLKLYTCTVICRHVNSEIKSPLYVRNTTIVAIPDILHITLFQSEGQISLSVLFNIGQMCNTVI